MPIEDFSLLRLSENHDIKPFHCGDEDLNGFLFEDAKPFQKELLAVTYLVESDANTVAYFSLLNDKISVSDTPSNRKWKILFKDIMPEGKRLRSYPAMKIGRFAVDKNHTGSGIGSDLLNYIKLLMLDNNKTGCKYITVDAYQNSLGFYLRNGFIFITENDKDHDTRLMYFDLSVF